MKRTNAEKVHGLYVPVPLRDYHFAYILKALRTLKDIYESEGMKGQVSFMNTLIEHFRKNFSLLVKETKNKRANMDNVAFMPLNHPEINPKEFYKVYMDPGYNVKKGEPVHT